MKISYESTAAAIFLLEVKMVVAHLASDYISELENRCSYLSILEGCGWTEQQFDQETLRRVDAGWKFLRPSPRGNHPMHALMPVSLNGMAGIPPLSI